MGRLVIWTVALLAIIYLVYAEEFDNAEEAIEERAEREIGVDRVKRSLFGRYNRYGKFGGGRRKVGGGSSSSEDGGRKRGNDSSSSDRGGRKRGNDSSSSDRGGRKRGNGSSSSDRGGRKRGNGSSSSEGDGRKRGNDSSSSDRAGRKRGNGSSSSDRGGRKRGNGSSSSDGDGRKRGNDSSSSERGGRKRGNDSSSSERGGRKRGNDSSSSGRGGRNRGNDSSSSSGGRGKEGNRSSSSSSSGGNNNNNNNNNRPRDSACTNTPDTNSRCGDRWFFKDGSCRRYSFGRGCSPFIRNSFKTKADCNQECIPIRQTKPPPTPAPTTPTPPGPCSEPPTTFKCKERWFFDAQNCKCEKYEEGFGNCPDDINTFPSKPECEKDCAGHYIGDPPIQCLFPPSIQTCCTPKWFYDPKTCCSLLESWLGCTGKNCFETSEECLNKCHDNGRGYRQKRSTIDGPLRTIRSTGTRKACDEEPDTDDTCGERYYYSESGKCCLKYPRGRGCSRFIINSFKSNKECLWTCNR